MTIPIFAPRRAAAGAASLPSNTVTPHTGAIGHSRVATVVGKNAGANGRAREIAALLIWTAAIFLALALASYAGDPPRVMGGDGAATVTAPGENWVGPVGEFFARGLVMFVGVIGWVLPLEMVLIGVPLVRGKPNAATIARIAGDLLIAVLAAALVQVGWPGKLAFGTHPASGMIGELFGELARSLFSTIGSFLVGFASLGLILIGRASFSFIAFARSLAQFCTNAAATIGGWLKSVTDAWNTARELERDRKEQVRLARLPKIDASPRFDATIAAMPRENQGGDDDVELGDACGDADTFTAFEGPATQLAQPSPKRRAPRKKKDANDSARETAVDSDATPGGDVAAFARSPLNAIAAPIARNVVSARGASPVESALLPLQVSAAAEMSPLQPEAIDEDANPTGAAAGKRARRPRESKEPKEIKEPTIVDTSAALVRQSPIPAQLDPELEDDSELPELADDDDVVVAPRAAGDAIVLHEPELKNEAAKEIVKVIPRRPPPFALPSIDFLVPAKPDAHLAIDKEKLFETAEKLVQTLAHYGVQGKVEDILPGPTVTTYEVSPAPGTKVSKVAGLADDLALALARTVRIVAPIPGKNRIGFEVPNDKRVEVVLRDLIEDRRFQALDVPLPVVLGRDILGAPVYADLAYMPHVIVAGATGAGKSVGLNVMLTSLLYRRTPEELRLLMIDPKVVELAPFDRIPHMLLPVVTDMKQAATALKWAVDEMERRYQLFADAGTKNIGTYNGWVKRVRSGEIKNTAARVVLAKDKNGFIDAIRPSDGEQGTAPLPETLPFIVIVVDEFADLMMTQGKEVEASVARLAQKARAAGMHVILATQRPSVDVITGIIKANFPTRIAYRVSQRVDSRTILDEQGAEHLLGMGDMLVKLNGTNVTKRVQCPWVSESEVQIVTDHLRAQGEPVYDDNILKPRDEDGDGADVEDAEQDPLYDDAVRIVCDTRRCSTSWLQRKLGLGYNRAARIVEMMERRGLVGAAHGAKDREVLVDAI